MFRIPAPRVLLFYVGIAGLAARGVESVWRLPIDSSGRPDARRLLRGLWGAAVASGPVAILAPRRERAPAGRMHTPH